MYLFNNQQTDYVRIAVSNRHLCERPLPQQIQRLAGRADLLILREKDLPPETYRCLSKEVLSACQTNGLPLSINSHINIAQELGITNIHLPFEIFRQCHHTLADFTMTGVSVHSIEEAEFAADHGADYIIAGHIFKTDCKKDLPPRGLHFLRALCKVSSVPVFAIGGIDDKNVREALACGAAGACQMSGYMKL